MKREPGAHDTNFILCVNYRVELIWSCNEALSVMEPAFLTACLQNKAMFTASIFKIETSPIYLRRCVIIFVNLPTVEHWKGTNSNKVHPPCVTGATTTLLPCLTDSLVQPHATIVYNLLLLHHCSHAVVVVLAIVSYYAYLQQPLYNIITMAASVTRFL